MHRVGTFRVRQEARIKQGGNLGACSDIGWWWNLFPNDDKYKSHLAKGIYPYGQGTRCGIWPRCSNKEQYLDWNLIAKILCFQQMYQKPPQSFGFRLNYMSSFPGSLVVWVGLFAFISTYPHEVKGLSCSIILYITQPYEEEFFILCKKINPAYTRPFATTILVWPGPTGLQGNRTLDAITRHFLGRQVSWSPWWVSCPFPKDLSTQITNHRAHELKPK